MNLLKLITYMKLLTCCMVGVAEPSLSSILTGEGHPVTIRTVEPRLSLKACRKAIDTLHKMQLQHLHVATRQGFAGEGTAYTAALDTLLSKDGERIRMGGFPQIRALILEGPEMDDLLPESVRISLAYLRNHPDLSDFHIVIGGEGLKLKESKTTAEVIYHRTQGDIFFRLDVSENGLRARESISVKEEKNRISNSVRFTKDFFDEYSPSRIAVVAHELSHVADVKKVVAAAKNNTLPDFLHPYRFLGVPSISRAHFNLASELRAQLEWTESLLALNRPMDEIEARRNQMYNQISHMFDALPDHMNPVSEYSLLDTENQRFNEEALQQYLSMVQSWFDNPANFQ